MKNVLIAAIKINNPSRANKIILPETNANAAMTIKMASRQCRSNIFSIANFINIFLLIR